MKTYYLDYGSHSQYLQRPYEYSSQRAAMKAAKDLKAGITGGGAYLTVRSGDDDYRTTPVARWQRDDETGKWYRAV